MVARRIIIEGKVQGVYFREWAVKIAHELDVAGWIRNLDDGRVEAYAVGDAASIGRFVARLREGSPASDVSRVAWEDAPIEKHNSFMRRQTASVGPPS